jgi:hypothetical protein
VGCVVLHCSLCDRKCLVQRTLKEAYSLECLVPTMKHGAGSVMVWAAISWYSVLLVPLLPFMAELLQGSAWPGWVIRCFHDLDVISEWCSFQGDNSHSWNCSVTVWIEWRWASTSSLAYTVTRFEHHWTSLVSLGTRVRNRFPPPTSLKQLEDVLQEELYKIRLETFKTCASSLQ